MQIPEVRWHIILYGGSQSVVSGLAASASPDGNSLEMQILGLHPNPPESETGGRAQQSVS